MSDFYEIDFLKVGTSKSGDAIAWRYQQNGRQVIGVVDGGFQETGEALRDHINQYYDNPSFIDYVVATHNDGDHAGGLRTILEEFDIGQLWMLRPWEYAQELLPRFARFTTVDGLSKRLKEIYPNLAELEDIANERNIEIYEPFRGNNIGPFKVLSPSKSRYLDLIVESEKTPEASASERVTVGSVFAEAFRGLAALIRSAWGEEVFPETDTSSENNMSIVQYGALCNQTILLTGDAGRLALTDAANYAQGVGITLPGIDRFQVPHHGSRHNVSSEILNRWLGKKDLNRLDMGQESFQAFISAATDDEKHPRKAVIRAMIHRKGKVYTTKFGPWLNTRSNNAPIRPYMSAATPLDYPEEQEE